MDSTNIKNSLAVPQQLPAQVTKLADTINSLQRAESALDNASKAIPPGELGQLMASHLTTIEFSGHQVIGVLLKVTAEIRDYINVVSKLPSRVKGVPKTVTYINVVTGCQNCATEANAIQLQCESAGKLLLNFHNGLNETISFFKSFETELNQRDETLNQSIEELRARLNAMSNEPWYDKILDAFKSLFENLQSKVNAEVACANTQERQIQLDQITIGSLNGLIGTMQDISNVTSAMGTSWRNLGDSVGTLASDLQAIGPSSFDSNGVEDVLAYVRSDWQNIASILAKIEA